jgi:hypothetical protein
MKPVAWTDGKGNYFDKTSSFPVDDLIPLYTHPVKTLAANEIEDCYQLWQALSGDPEKLYQLFKLKEQEK